MNLFLGFIIKYAYYTETYFPYNMFRNVPIPLFMGELLPLLDSRIVISTFRPFLWRRDIKAQELVTTSLETYIYSKAFASYCNLLLISCCCCCCCCCSCCIMSTFLAPNWRLILFHSEVAVVRDWVIIVGMCSMTLEGNKAAHIVFFTS